VTIGNCFGGTGSRHDLAGRSAATGRRQIRAVSELALCAMFFVFATGCMSSHRLYLYPVCFYESAPDQQRVQDYFAPRLVSVVDTTTKVRKGSKIALSPDGRWLVANVTESQNERIAAVWPRLGCIGNALDSPRTKQESDCVSYERQFVDSREYFTFGNAKDAGGFDIWNESAVANTLVHCHQIKEDEQSNGAAK
jgi:hypothetical protein